MNEQNNNQNYQQTYQQPVNHQNNGEKNTLGMLSLIFGIIGFLTAFIAIGILFDIAAIILGIIALVKKNHKKGLGIAGIVIASISLILMLIIGLVYNSYSKNKTVVKSNEVAVTSEDLENNEALTSNAKSEMQKEDEISSDKLDISEYSYENTIGDTLHFLVIKNNSNYTIKVSSNTTALDSSGTILGANSSELEALGSGCESCLIDYFDGVENIDKFEYTLSLKEDPYYESVISDLSYETSEQRDKVIVTCTNNGSEPAEFVEVIGLFFKNGELVNYDSTYVTDDDSELKPGATLSEELNCYDGYDEVKIYFTGRK